MKTSTTLGTTSKPKTFKNLNLNVAQQAAKAQGPPKTTTGVRGSLTVIQGNTRVTKPFGAAAAPVPVNTPSIRKEKGEEFDVSLVPSGKNSVWGAAETSSKAGAGDVDKAGSQKMTSWADIDSDDDDYVDHPVGTRNLNQDGQSVSNGSREIDREMNLITSGIYDARNMQEDRRGYRSDSFEERGGQQRSSSWCDNGDSRSTVQYNYNEPSSGYSRDYSRQNYGGDSNRYGDERMNQWRNSGGMGRAANSMPPPPMQVPLDPIEAARQEREQLEMKKKLQDEQKLLKKRQVEIELEMRANGLDPDFYRGGHIPVSAVHADRHIGSSSSGRNDSQYGIRMSTNSINSNGTRYIETDDMDRWERGAKQQQQPPPQPLVAASPPIHVSKIQTRDRSDSGSAAEQQKQVDNSRSFRQVLPAHDSESSEQMVHTEALHSRDRQYSDDCDERAMRSGLKVNAEDTDRCERATSKPKMLFDPKSNKMVDLSPALPGVKSAPKAGLAKAVVVEKKPVVKKPTAKEDKVAMAAPRASANKQSALEGAPAVATAVVSTAGSPPLQVSATEFKPLVLVRPRSVSEEKEKLDKVMAAALSGGGRAASKSSSNPQSGAAAAVLICRTSSNSAVPANPTEMVDASHIASSEAARKARLKEKAERGSRTHGLLFRYNKSGEIEEVLLESPGKKSAVPAKTPAKAAPAAAGEEEVRGKKKGKKVKAHAAK